MPTRTKRFSAPNFDPLRRSIAALERRRGGRAAFKHGFTPGYSEECLEYGARRRVRFRAGRHCPATLRAKAAACFANDDEWSLPPARGHAAVLGSGDALSVRAGAQGARLLLLAARSLREPVVQYGPFVMNTRAEIDQALRDYRDRSLAAVAQVR